jgi:hypothetical protein
METRGACFGFEVSVDGDPRGLFRIRGELGTVRHDRNAYSEAVP